MIRLTSARQALALRGQIPELAILRMLQIGGGNDRYDPTVLILQEGDDISQIPEIGPYGLLDVIDSEWRCYERVEAFEEDGGTAFEMIVFLDDDRTLSVVIPDKPWVDTRLRVVLEVETEGRIQRLPDRS